MDSGVAQPLRSALGVLAVARMLGDVWEQAGIENALPIVRGTQTAIGIEIGSVEISTNLFGHLFQCLQALR
jgi:hypothetical protein